MWWVLLSSLALAGPDVYGFGNGQLGNVTISNTTTVSASRSVSGNFNPGSTAVIVADGSAFPTGTLVVLHQSAGATVTNTFAQPPPAANPSALGVGHYEFARVAAQVGNTLTLDAPTLYGYDNDAQVVAVAEYASLNVSGLLNGPVWDGNAGGIVAVAVDGDLDLTGTIDASGRGFRGGPQDSYTGYDGSCSASNDNPNQASNKGDGFAGFGTIGRSTRGNAGGGGNCQNAGGGGGGNQGYGGRGGFGYEGGGGDNRGGFGGAGSAPTYTTHVLLGGGGGAGDTNNNIPDSRGAPGGGIILIRARRILGGGSIRARGADAVGNIDDGAGGGGAGGTVIVRTLTTLGCGQIDASGGDGGDVADGVSFPGLAHGPGGGGGGGRIVTESGLSGCTADVSGGPAGVFDGSDPWGSQNGAAGLVTGMGSTFADGDGDGEVVGPGGLGPDCDDTDATVAPGLPELCDGLDNDCDGATDEGLTFDTWYADSDGDGFGNNSVLVSACLQPPGYVLNNGDCNDGNASIYPGAGDATCDGVDDDCDIVVDEDAPTFPWYADTDSDTYGAGTAVFACSAPTGRVASDTDCDDSNASVNPGASDDTCNGVDNDCDGSIDEGAPTATYYFDADGDGYGDDSTATVECASPGAGWVLLGGDCADLDGSRNPGEPDDTCNRVDNDCDGSVDEDAPVSAWYLDSDGDTWGDTAAGTFDCAAPSASHVLTDGDCDDSQASVNPGVPNDASCNATDDDCDGSIDEDAPTSTWYVDADGDGYGNTAVSQQACSQPAGYELTDGDCDDTAPGVNPGVPIDDTCDAVDDDCDGSVDEDAATQSYWTDSDGDGWGVGSTIVACAQPPGTAPALGDCDDTNGAVSPSATEVCNGIDDDCDTLTDEFVLLEFYDDDDGDGYGDALAVTLACIPPAGTTADDTDCNDAVASINPGAPEVCNDRDDDCDSQVDEGIPLQTWYLDLDQDGFGQDTLTLQDCGAPPGYVAASGDCDDTVASINPAASEECNLLDDDCNGLVDDGNPDAATWYLDADGDGRGGDADTRQECFQPTPQHVLDDGDCDDTNAAVAPGQFEVCNGIDDDCNGLVDDDDPGVTDPVEWYPDLDGDGYGDGVPVVACQGPSGTTTTAGDCDDADPTRSPGAIESCDSIDNDCNGLADDSDPDVVGELWYVDADGDGVGGPTEDRTTCNGGPGLALTTGDCDESDPLTFPGAMEPCEPIDRDCDGVVAGEWLYVDADGDLYGDPDFEIYTCDADEGVADDTDCDDADDTVFPGAPEVPGDGIDQDCDGADLPAVPVETADTADTDSDVDTDTDTDVDTDTDPPVTEVPDGRATGCKCDSGGSAPVGMLVLLGGLLARRR